MDESFFSSSCEYNRGRIQKKMKMNLENGTPCMMVLYRMTTQKHGFGSLEYTSLKNMYDLYEFRIELRRRWNWCWISTFKWEVIFEPTHSSRITITQWQDMSISRWIIPWICRSRHRRAHAGNRTRYARCKRLVQTFQREQRIPPESLGWGRLLQTPLSRNTRLWVFSSR